MLFRSFKQSGLGQHNTSGVFMELRGKKLDVDLFLFFLNDD
jgi:hypothetical protein